MVSQGASHFVVNHYQCVPYKRWGKEGAGTLSDGLTIQYYLFLRDTYAYLAFSSGNKPRFQINHAKTTYKRKEIFGNSDLVGKTVTKTATQFIRIKQQEKHRGATYKGRELNPEPRDHVHQSTSYSQPSSLD